MPLIRRPSAGGGVPIDPNALTYTNATPTPVSLGGISSASTFDKKTMTNMWDKLLYPYQLPTFSSFSIQGTASALEVGTQLDAIKVFTWTTTNSANIKTDSINIDNITDAITIAISLTNNGTYTSTVTTETDYTPLVATSKLYRISSTNTNETTFNRNHTVNWFFKVFVGESESETLDEAGIESLRSGIVGTIKQLHSMLAGGYKYFVVPTSYSQPTSFVDPSTTFAVPMNEPYLVTVTNTLGVEEDYNVYRSVNILNSAININIT